MTVTANSLTRAWLVRVLNNFAEYGFNYRSVMNTDGAAHGLNPGDTADRILTTGECHLSLTNISNRGRKIGLLIGPADENEPPAGIIHDIGTANEGDMPIATRCIMGA
jgi:hypothetical protein